MIDSARDGRRLGRSFGRLAVLCDGLGLIAVGLVGRRVIGMVAGRTQTAASDDVASGEERKQSDQISQPVSNGEKGIRIGRKADSVVHMRSEDVDRC
ncbi:hypothetical protein [Streptomyces sp. MUM 178J]|uniref:hypothetical protein n=1 Tax=Streptomyces sp. MUM 178J TaxID=2791991 RepID=UPI001F045DE9|nr:hypothetical protein [Streptomyces sp. MUM 178J]WRQ80036.1 hypothetical protein I3F59_012120 [Streptomyces sp. MUM 178J]